MLFTLLIIAIIIAILALLLHLSLDKKVVYQNLKNKHVIVTGGSSGIGKAAATEAAKLGAHVTIIGRDVGKLKAAVFDISAAGEAGQKIQYCALDVTANYEEIRECFSKLETNIAPIFMLINSAGMCICGEFENMKSEDIKYLIDINYFGTAYPTKYVLTEMKKRDEGIIVFVLSEAAMLGIYGYSAYSASKWAVRGLAEAVLMELVGTNVRVMLSFPADTDTPGYKNEELTKPIETKLISGSGGLYTPDEIGKKLVHDALIGKTYSVYGLTGKLLSLLQCASIENVWQILSQVFCMGILRTVAVGILLHFHKIVRDSNKEKKFINKAK